MFLKSKTVLFSAALVVSPLLFSAAIGCEVKVCDNDDPECGVSDRDDDDLDESGAAGSSSDESDNSSSAAGSGGSSSSDSSSFDQGSTEAELILDCHAEGEVNGTPGDTSPTVGMEEEDYECQACAERLCAEQLSNCYAEGPYSVCLYGTTTLMDDGGESSCMLDCFLDLEDDLSLSEFDVSDCAARCASNECESEQASVVTQDLMRCLLDTEGNDAEELGCVAECGLDLYLDF